MIEVAIDKILEALKGKPHLIKVMFSPRQKICKSIIKQHCPIVCKTLSRRSTTEDQKYPFLKNRNVASSGIQNRLISGPKLVQHWSLTWNDDTCQQKVLTIRGELTL